MTAGDVNDPIISEMSYNSALDELFLADNRNKVVRAMRQRRRPARRVQRHSTRLGTCSVECVPHERLGHTARVFGRRRAGRGGGKLAGGTEPQRQRVARGATRADRRIWTDQLRAE